MGTEVDTLLLLPPTYNNYFNLLKNVDGSDLCTTGVDSMIPIVDCFDNEISKSSLQSDNFSISSNRRNSNSCDNEQIPKFIC